MQITRGKKTYTLTIEELLAAAEEVAEMNRTITEDHQVKMQQEHASAREADDAWEKEQKKMRTQLPYPANLYVSVVERQEGVAFLNSTEAVQQDYLDGLEIALKMLAEDERLALRAYYKDLVTMEAGGVMLGMKSPRQAFLHKLRQAKRRLRHPARYNAIRYGKTEYLERQKKMLFVPDETTLDSDLRALGLPHIIEYRLRQIGVENIGQLCQMTYADMLPVRLLGADKLPTLIAAIKNAGFDASNLEPTRGATS